MMAAQTINFISESSADFEARAAMPEYTREKLGSADM